MLPNLHIEPRGKGKPVMKYPKTKTDQTKKRKEKVANKAALKAAKKSKK